MLLLNFSNNYFNIFISSLGGSSSNWSDMNCGNKEDFFKAENWNSFGLEGLSGKQTGGMERTF